MNLENFRKDYIDIIKESTGEDLRNYIRSIVESVITERVKSKDYNVSKKRNIHAGNYPYILNAVNEISGKKTVELKMSAKESDLVDMENALKRNPKDKTVLSKLGSRINEQYGVLPLTMAAMDVVSGYGPGEYNMPMVPKKFNLDEIEAALVRAKKEMSPLEYEDFIEGEEEDQEALVMKFQYLLPAHKLLNWVMDN